MKMIKNLSVEDAEDIVDDIEDVSDLDAEKQTKIYKQRASNLKFLKKNKKETEE
jgi:hypothetical protein